MIFSGIIIVVSVVAIAVVVGILRKTKKQLGDEIKHGQELEQEKQRLQEHYANDRNALIAKFNNTKERWQIQINEKIKGLTQTITGLKADNAKLARWRPILDVEAKIQTMLLEAERASRSILFDAEQREKDTRQKQLEVAERIVRELDVLEHHKQKAAIEASELISKAQKQADEMIGGINSEVQRQSSILKSIENRIKGYGIEYMIPGIGLLDELAESFGYTEAGQELKQARTAVKQLFKSGKAAECDYVETSRKITAIGFVADAFNGKVEEILSRVKHDNYGKLSQEIHDAATLVNVNGAAFRNARITNEYAAARLEELRWATIVHQLKLREKEEQKAIREQMKEEEKVRKEIEKAKKEAEKSEEIARKAYEEAMKRFETMNAEQQADHRKEIEEMKERLRLAEENKRTISLAEQTKVGHVYIISNIGSFGENVFKIGMTRRLEPQDRVDELGDASVPFPFDVHAFIRSENAPELETKLHKHFLIQQMNKENHRKEFFRLSIDEIRKAIDTLGVETHWTMIAEAEQYRQTLEIERRITIDSNFRAQWEAKQVLLENTEYHQES